MLNQQNEQRDLCTTEPLRLCQLVAFKENVNKIDISLSR